MNGVALSPLYGISLFSGIGGLDLGIEHIIPNSRTVCYVEGETYAAQVLHAKMLKGELPHAPIYSDVRSFPSVAHHFSKKVDFITAGFPCQPFSNAGSRKGTQDHRWLWDSILQTIGKVRPSFLFLENVSNLLNDWGAFDEISKSLSKIGFNLEWGLVRASDIGANHQRNRLFIFAYLPSGLYRIKTQLSNPNLYSTNTNRQRRKKSHITQKPIKKGLLGRENNEPSWWRGNPPFPPVCRVDDGISYGMDRLRALGNAVVPLQAAHAFYALIQRAINHPSRF